MAVTHLPEPHPTDPVVAQLTRMYREAYDATLRELQVAVVAGLSTTYRTALLQQLGRRVAELRAETLAWSYGPVDPRTGARRLSQGALYMAVAQADRETLRQLAAIGLTVEVPAAGAVSASFALLNHEAVRLVAQNIVISLNRAVDQFDRSVREIIGRAENDLFRRQGLQTVGQKLTEGLTVRQARARMVNDLTGKGITAFVDTRGRAWNLKSYSDMAVRTITREATSEATLRRVEAEGHDYLIATAHRPTCPICAVRQGRVYCISGTDSRFPSLATVGNTPWHPNCFPAGVLVSGPSVLAHMTRPYQGEMVIIRTAGGHKLPVTPNHPILTPKGWVAAGSLKEGDQVFEHIRSQGTVEGVNPDDVLVPIPIEDVPEALWKPSRVATSRVPVAPEDFHGDGEGSEVCVIRSDRLLSDGLDAAGLQPSGQSLFSMAPVFGLHLPGQSALFEFGEASLCPPDGGVGGGNLFASALSRLTGGPNSACLGTGRSGHDAGFSQALVDGHLCDTHLASYVALGHAGLIEANNLRDIERHALVGNCPPLGTDVTEPNPLFPETHLKGPQSNAYELSDLFRRLSGLVQADYVIEINRRPFSGHVYNLQTTEGWYVANSIITHNCGHSLVPWSEAYEPNLEAVLARSQESMDIDPRSAREAELYERSQKIRAEQRRKRKLTEALQAPNLSDEDQVRLRRLRAAANRRLIDHNRAQRKALPGWR